MRQVRFRDPGGSTRTGEWTDGAIEAAGRTFDRDEITVLPPTQPSKIICLARNYREHASEIPDRPEFFMKGPNAIAGHGDTVTLPAGHEVHYEGEVGVVIGEQCRNVPEERVQDVIAGFTCFDDVSNRTDQRNEINWIRGKAFDNAAPMGPVVATPDHVSNPEDPRVRLWVNGEKKQDSREDELIYSVSEAIAELTSLLTLEAGDVVAMGTSGHPEPLSDGDTVEIEVDGVGTLEHDVRREGEE